MLKKIRFFYFNPFKKLTQGTLVKHKKTIKEKIRKIHFSLKPGLFKKFVFKAFLALVYTFQTKKSLTLSVNGGWRYDNHKMTWCTIFCLFFKKMLSFAATQMPQNKTKQKIFLTLHIIIHIHFILYKV